MKKGRKRLFIPKSAKRCTIVTVLLGILAAAVLPGLYLNYARNRYQQMAKAEATQLARSVSALLHAEHIEALAKQSAPPEGCLVEESLTTLVEVTDSIYYAYILSMRGESAVVVADSSAAKTDSSRPTKRNCEETTEINLLPFETGQSLVTDPISAPCGRWIRVLIPLHNVGGGGRRRPRTELFRLGVAVCPVEKNDT